MAQFNHIELLVFSSFFMWKGSLFYKIMVYDFFSLLWRNCRRLWSVRWYSSQEDCLLLDKLTCFGGVCSTGWNPVKWKPVSLGNTLIFQNVLWVDFCIEIIILFYFILFKFLKGFKNNVWVCCACYKLILKPI